MTRVQAVLLAAATLLTASASAQAPQTCEPGFRLFDHELLVSEPVCIPENPERVLALDMASVEMTLLTGKTLVGASGWILSEFPVLEPSFGSRLTGVEDVGYPASLETTLLLEPDIILAAGGSVAGESIDGIRARDIAPVVMADPRIYEDWQLGTSFWASVLGAEDLYAQMLTNYDARVGELQKALGTPSETTVSIVPVATGSVYMWMPDTAPGKIIGDVGLARPDSQTLLADAAAVRYGAAQYVQVSEERFDLLDADTIFYFTYAASDPATAEEEAGFVTELEENPLWQSLPAVRDEQAFFVGGYWWRAQTYTLASRVLDDLFTHLTGSPSKTPALSLEATR